MRTAQPTRVRPVAHSAVTAELVRGGALRRVVRWQPAVAALVVGCALLLRNAGGVHDQAGAVALLRGIGAVTVLGAVFVLDDAARRFAEPTQLSARYRLLVRVSIALIGIGVGFTGASVVLRAHVAAAELAGVALELLAATLLGLAVAAVAARRQGVDEPGVLTAPVVVGGLMAAQFLPQRWALLSPPGAGWAAAHGRWALLLVVAVVCLAVASRDLAE